MESTRRANRGEPPVRPTAQVERTSDAEGALAWVPSTPVQVRSAPGGSPFCVPAALSALTGQTTKETTDLLKEHWFGDSLPRGVFYPAALKILQVLDYKYQEWGFLEPGGLYLVLVPGHALVWYENKFFDNSNPTGTNQGTTRKFRIQKIFRVWKED